MNSLFIFHVCQHQSNLILHLTCQKNSYLQLGKCKNPLTKKWLVFLKTFQSAFKIIQVSGCSRTSSLGKIQHMKKYILILEDECPCLPFIPNAALMLSVCIFFSRVQNWALTDLATLIFISAYDHDLYYIGERRKSLSSSAKATDWGEGV